MSAARFLRSPRPLGTPALVLSVTVLLIGLTGSLTGCRSPNKANIALRKEIQQLQDQIQTLQAEREGDAAMIASLQDRVGTLPTLPSERLRRLFTTHGLKFGRLTGGADLDRAQPGHEGLKVHVVPVDKEGQSIKSAGSFTVEAFDTSRPNDALVGRWEFPLEDARKHWHGGFSRYEYVLTCPWPGGPPGQPRLHVDVTFLDELTQARFKETVDVEVELPPPQAGGTAEARPQSPADESPPRSPGQ